VLERRGPVEIKGYGLEEAWYLIARAPDELGAADTRKLPLSAVRG
jgi:hypothetical protein